MRPTVSEVSREVFSGVKTMGVSMLGGQRSRGGVALLLDHTGRLLLVHARYRKQWNLPGGFLGPDEDPEAGIRRELTEEVSLPADAPPIPLRVIQSRRHHDEHVACAQLHRDVAIKLRLSSWELRGMRWCGPHELPSLHAITLSVLAPEYGLIVANGKRWSLGPEVATP